MVVRDGRRPAGSGPHAGLDRLLVAGQAGCVGGRRLGDFLVVWSVGFALVHAVWALGWRAGVPADQPPIADRPVFLAYDVVAGLPDAWFTVAGAAGLVLWRSARRTVDRDVVTSRPWAGGRPQGSA